MKRAEVFANTAERLGNYYAFEGDVVEAVANVAVIQSGMNFDEFMRHVNMPEPELYSPNGSYPIQIVDIKPSDDYNEQQVRLMHLPMGNGLDKNQLYQLATTFAADPTIRTIAFGNLSGLGRDKPGALSPSALLYAFRGDSRQLVDRQLRYVAGNTSGKSAGTKIENRAFSAGCLLALLTTENADLYDLKVGQVTAIEPGDAKPRNILKPIAMASLGGDFIKTAGPLSGYVEASGIDAYSDLQGGSALGLVKYGMGVLRASNLIVAGRICGDNYEKRARAALDMQTMAELHTIWGSESELVIDGLMSSITKELSEQYCDRSASTRILGGRHNMVNDIHLQSALFLHASAA